MRRSDAKLPVAVAVAALLLVGTGGDALAYCRTTVCNAKTTGATCFPSQPSDCGTPLFWASPCIGYWLQKDASNQVSLAVASTVFKKAFASWMTATCKAGGTPRIQALEQPPAVECHLHEYNNPKANANIIMFHDDVWPYTGGANTLALTTVTYNLDTGEIYDADMEINSTPNIPLTTGDTNVMYDLQAIITHEAGHFLGLAHSMDHNAVMYPAYSEGSISQRTLDDDDRAGICAVDPPGPAIPASCDVTPRHGFSSLCAASQPASASSSTGTGTPGSSSNGGCTCTTGASDERGLPAHAFAAAFAILAAAGRRRRGHA